MFKKFDEGVKMVDLFLNIFDDNNNDLIIILGKRIKLKLEFQIRVPILHHVC